MNKVTFNLEVLLPTQVTREIEFPLFIENKKEKTIFMFTYDNDIRYLPFHRIEIKEYSDGSFRIYHNHEDESTVSRMIAELNGRYNLATKDDFLKAFKTYLDQIIEVYSQLNNN